MFTTSSLRYMVEMTGVEPAWTCSQSKRVTVTLHLDIKLLSQRTRTFGNNGWIRVCSYFPTIFRRLTVSIKLHCFFILTSLFKNYKTQTCVFSFTELCYSITPNFWKKLLVHSNRQYGTDDGTWTRMEFPPQVFLTTLCRHSRIKRCSLDYVFTLSFDLGGWYIVSTHLLQ